jgi:RNA polymerase I-specific transcription initiation factor RRN3
MYLMLIHLAPKTSLLNVPPVDDEEIFERIHITLQNILTLIPASKAITGDVLEKSFPYHAAPAKDYINHMNNLLKMRSYCADLTPLIMRSIVEKTVQIDVQVAVDVDPLEDDEQEELILVVHKAMNDLKSEQISGVIGVSEVEEDEGEEEEGDTPEKVLKRMKESMMKLDSAIDSLFEHYEASYRHNASGDSNNFSQLISMFTRSILTTTGSRCIQYLLFRFAQLDKTIYANFVSALLKSAFDRNLAIPVRCTAISYLSSFAARGARLENEVVRSLFDRLSKESEKLRNDHEATSSGPDAEKFRIYYTIFQGLMYIFCFRWRAFLLEPQEDESDDGYQWMPNIRETFNRHILSKMNPLKVCAPVLVEMFAKVTKHLNFLYLYSILETNKRVRLVRSVQYATFARESTLSQNHSESALQLTSQYAFEPYILPISKRWITNLYINFSDVAPVGLDEEDTSDEDDSGGDDDEDT